nr:class I SAM-dependent methyltransferase [Kineosporia rhizophila]
MWATGAAGWVANEAIYDSVYAPVTAAVLGAADLRPQTTILDVGCGTGTLVQAASHAGSSATGIDISPAMVEAAKNRVPQAEIVLGDAQDENLNALPGAPFQRVISRFGVMFFPDPVAAFSNLRLATSTGGRLVFACWRGLSENTIFTAGLERLTERVAQPAAPVSPGAPGPVAFADPDLLRGILDDSGWQQISIEALDFVCDFGALNGTDGVEERLAVVLGGPRARHARAELEPVLGPAGWNDLVEQIRQDLRAARDPGTGTLRVPAAVWLVQAVNR